MPDLSLVVGSDGRHLNEKALNAVLGLAFANGISKIYVSSHPKALFSTPAVSHFVRQLQPEVCIGSLCLTASHNKGGVDGDFGVKMNDALGAPLKEAQTSKVYALTQTIHQFKRVEGVFFFADGHEKIERF